MIQTNRLGVYGLGLAIVLSSAAALAFPKLRYWDNTANSAQAGAAAPHNGQQQNNKYRIYYTGGAKDYFMNCAHCHIKGNNPQGMIGATITPSPAWQIVNNQKAYQPGATYTITIAMTGEHLGMGANPADNGNGMTATFEDAGGNPIGAMASDAANNGNPAFAAGFTCPANAPVPEPMGPTTYMFGDCRAVMSTQGPAAGVTSWTFKWKAPAAGKGTVTLYYGIVDGDHHEQDCLNDDVKVGNIPLLEGN